MEIYEYTFIAASPVILLLIMLLIIICIFYIKGKLSNLVDFIVFNVFPSILKSKKDDRNQSLVYFRKEKVLLPEETLPKVNKALFGIFWSLILCIMFGFGQLAFIEYSYDCQDVDQGKDCFEYPVTSGLDAVRANCSDPDILQGKKLVICYRLVFQFELAIGVCYGMYKICTVLLSIVSTLIIKMDENQVKWFKRAVLIIYGIVLITVGVLVSVFQSHSSLRFNVSKIKLFLYIFLGIITLIFFIFYMPWEEIIEQKNRPNTEEEIENPVTESSRQSRQTGGTGEGSRVQEVGLVNQISPTSLA